MEDTFVGHSSAAQEGNFNDEASDALTLPVPNDALLSSPRTAAETHRQGVGSAEQARRATTGVIRTSLSLIHLLPTERASISMGTLPSNLPVAPDSTSHLKTAVPASSGDKLALVKSSSCRASLTDFEYQETACAEREIKAPACVKQSQAPSSSQLLVDVRHLRSGPHPTCELLVPAVVKPGRKAARGSQELPMCVHTLAAEIAKIPCLDADAQDYIRQRASTYKKEALEHVEQDELVPGALDGESLALQSPALEATCSSAVRIGSVIACSQWNAAHTCRTDAGNVSRENPTLASQFAVDIQSTPNSMQFPNDIANGPRSMEPAAVAAPDSTSSGRALQQPEQQEIQAFAIRISCRSPAASFVSSTCSNGADLHELPLSPRSCEGALSVAPPHDHGRARARPQQQQQQRLALPLDLYGLPYVDFPQAAVMGRHGNRRPEGAHAACSRVPSGHPHGHLKAKITQPCSGGVTGGYQGGCMPGGVRRPEAAQRQGGHINDRGPALAALEAKRRQLMERSKAAVKAPAQARGYAGIHAGGARAVQQHDSYGKQAMLRDFGAHAEVQEPAHGRAQSVSPGRLRQGRAVLSKLTVQAAELRATGHRREVSPPLARPNAAEGRGGHVLKPMRGGGRPTSVPREPAAAARVPAGGKGNQALGRTKIPPAGTAQQLPTQTMRRHTAETFPVTVQAPDVSRLLPSHQIPALPQRSPLHTSLRLDDLFSGRTVESSAPPVYNCTQATGIHTAAALPLAARIAAATLGGASQEPATAFAIVSRRTTREETDLGQQYQHASPRSSTLDLTHLLSAPACQYIARRHATHDNNGNAMAHCPMDGLLSNADARWAAPSCAMATAGIGLEIPSSVGDTSGAGCIAMQPLDGAAPAGSRRRWEADARNFVVPDIEQIQAATSPAYARYGPPQAAASEQPQTEFPLPVQAPQQRSLAGIARQLPLGKRPAEPKPRGRDLKSRLRSRSAPHPRPGPSSKRQADPPAARGMMSPPDTRRQSQLQPTNADPAIHPSLNVKEEAGGSPRTPTGRLVHGRRPEDLALSAAAEHSRARLAASAGGANGSIGGATPLALVRPPESCGGMPRALGHRPRVAAPALTPRQPAICGAAVGLGAASAASPPAAWRPAGTHTSTVETPHRHTAQTEPVACGPSPAQHEGISNDVLPNMLSPARNYDNASPAKTPQIKRIMHGLASPTAARPASPGLAGAMSARSHGSDKPIPGSPCVGNRHRRGRQYNVSALGTGSPARKPGLKAKGLAPEQELARQGVVGVSTASAIRGLDSSDGNVLMTCTSGPCDGLDGSFRGASAAGTPAKDVAPAGSLPQASSTSAELGYGAIAPGQVRRLPLVAASQPASARAVSPGAGRDATHGKPLPQNAPAALDHHRKDNSYTSMMLARQQQQQALRSHTPSTFTLSGEDGGQSGFSDRQAVDVAVQADTEQRGDVSSTAGCFSGACDTASSQPVTAGNSSRQTSRQTARSDPLRAAVPAQVNGPQHTLIRQAVWHGMADVRVANALAALEAGICVFEPTLVDDGACRAFQGPAGARMASHDIADMASKASFGCLGRLVFGRRPTPQAAKQLAVPPSTPHPPILHVCASPGAGVELVLSRAGPQRPLASSQGLILLHSAPERMKAAALIDVQPPIRQDAVDDGSSTARSVAPNGWHRWVQVVGIAGGVVRISAVTPADHAKLVLGLNAALQLVVGATTADTPLAAVPLRFVGCGL